MHKKLITAFLALAVLAALTVPIVASAAPELTQPTGTTLGEGAKIEATNVGLVTFTSSSFNVQCSVGRLAGTLKGNTGTEIGWEISVVELKGTGANSDCTSGIGAANFIPNTGTNGTPWCMRATAAMAQDEFTIAGGVCGNQKPIRFGLAMTTQGTTCVYEKETSMTGTYTTHPNDAVISISEAKFTKVAGDHIVCPGEMKLDMSFTLEKEAAGPEPAYIS